ncbi:nitroreductase family protein [Clostridium sp.]|uniref:nitroreductase family protein n=2 Tax=Clostridium sp. TaxID=1506 RepID=UPI002E7A0360|nr:nitroreductase family protein [Clostridium sp.]MEE0568249.1 nitroreductase family protein [Clostridium sp.]
MSELDFIYKRKSIRDYKDAVIPKEDILKMLDAATHAPSPKHQQNWHFVVVQDKEIINKMAEAVSKSHEYIASLTKNEDEKKKFMRVLPYYINFQRASCAILVYANEYKMVEEKILRENNVGEDIIEVMKSTQSAAQGIGAAVENFMLAATAMGYGTCYMTGPAHAKKEIEEIINFEKPEYSLMSIISLGVPADETPDSPKRKPLEEVVTFI